MKRDLGKPHIKVVDSTWRRNAGESEEECSLGCSWRKSDHDDDNQYSNEKNPPPSCIGVIHRPAITL